jgi:transcriptional regulator with XRE-family HTH domain
MGTDRREISLFARNVAMARKRLDLTQVEVSSRSSIHVTEVSRMERGLRDPPLSTLVRLARALEVAPGALLELEPKARAVRLIRLALSKSDVTQRFDDPNLKERTFQCLQKL